MIVCKKEAVVSNGILFVIPNPLTPFVAAPTVAVRNLIDLWLSRSGAIPKLVLLLFKSDGDMEESILKLEYILTNDWWS